VLGNVHRRIAALPLAAKVLVAIAALIALAILIAASPFVVVVAALVLVVAVIALIFRFLRRRPLRRWGFIALASLLILIVFTSISNAVYPGLQSQQASSPSEPKQEAKSAPPETATEATTEGTTTQPEATTKTAASEPSPTTSQPGEAEAKSDGR
jgi:predicted PurR-regulated permease PerM